MTTKVSRDDLSQVIADSLNLLDNTKVAYFLGTEASPTDLKDFISTGASLLDLAISNRPNGGLACGRITELTGLEGSGKSLIAAAALADTQRRGGVAVLIDTESAVNYQFFNAIGLDMTKMVYVSENVIEIIFTYIEHVIQTVRKSDNGKLVTIVVDSIAGATTEQEAESEHGKDGYATGKAIIISKALRKITKLIADQKIALIFTNQLRQKLNAMPFADPWTTSGGKAIAFHASTRVRLTVAGTIKDPDNNVVGVKCKAKVIKNRLGPPYREAEFNILFDRGIDDLGSWYDTMKERKLIKQAGSSTVWTDPASDTEHKFTKGSMGKYLKDNPAVKEAMYAQLCEAMVMPYSGDTTELVETLETPEE